MRALTCSRVKFRFHGHRPSISLECWAIDFRLLGSPFQDLGVFGDAYVRSMSHRPGCGPMVASGLDLYDFYLNVLEANGRQYRPSF